MRKRKKTVPQALSRYTQILFALGIILIAPPLFYLAMILTSLPSLLPGAVTYYARILEHILAALALLTAGCYLTERATQQENKDRR